MRNLAIPQEVINKTGVPQIIDITDQLPVNKNYTWAQLAGTRDINDLTTVAWHHDDIAKSLRAGWDNLSVAKRIAENHIELTKNEKKGDAGFPYHFWIRGGQIYQCNNVLDRTYGVGSNNGYTVHVCVSGSYAGKDALEDADKRALQAVTLMLMRSLPQYQAIKAHSELNATDCPGYDYAAIRNETVNLDMKLKQEATWAGKVKMVNEVANQYAYMTNLMKAGENDGDAQWAANQLLAVREILIAQKLL
jgi:hypothetical protein